MSSSWVAGSVRAKLLTSRRLGSAHARDLAASPSLAAAVERLSRTSYGHDVAIGMDLDEAQVAVAATLLWHLRVLAGWVPPGGGEMMRALAAWFEIANVQSRFAFFRTGERRSLFQLGSLATAWPALSEAASASELHQILAQSAWAGRGNEQIEDVLTSMHLRWAARVRDVIPFAGTWVAAASLLYLARLLFLAPRLPTSAALEGGPGLPVGWRTAASIAQLSAIAPVGARWVLDGIHEPEDLWMAERRWWRHLGDEAAKRIVRGGSSPETVVAATMLLAVDAWRTRAALAAAAHPTGREVFDAVA
ncbi:MAG TPA: hypothetical protein VET65_07850 [Candidatus Limnocylindrales bacterium]|nr:hypothetical protein [Candidatus Limnocylindrales bacterium]